jgi:hypothetical protein
VGRHKVGLHAGVDAEAQGVVVHGDLLLQAAARHSRRCCSSSLCAVAGWLARSFLCGEERKGSGFGLGLDLYSSSPVTSL